MSRKYSASKSPSMSESFLIVLVGAAQTIPVEGGKIHWQFLQDSSDSTLNLPIDKKFDVHIVDPEADTNDLQRIIEDFNTMNDTKHAVYSKYLSNYLKEDLPQEYTQIFIILYSAEAAFSVKDEPVVTNSENPGNPMFINIGDAYEGININDYDAILEMGSITDLRYLMYNYYVMKNDLSVVLNNCDLKLYKELIQLFNEWCNVLNDHKDNAIVKKLRELFIKLIIDNVSNTISSFFSYLNRNNLTYEYNDIGTLNIDASKSNAEEYAIKNNMSNMMSHIKKIVPQVPRYKVKQDLINVEICGAIVRDIQISGEIRDPADQKWINSADVITINVTKSSTGGSSLRDRYMNNKKRYYDIAKSQ